jgi:hypothetical protein
MALTAAQRARLSRLTGPQLSCLGTYRHDWGRWIPGKALPRNWHPRMVDGTAQVTMTCLIGCGRQVWYWAPDGLIDWTDPHYTGGDQDGSKYLAEPDEAMERWMYRSELDARTAKPLLMAARAAAQHERVARRREPVASPTFQAASV